MTSPDNNRSTPVTTPAIPKTGPAVEWKVKAATAGSYVGGVVALALLAGLSDGSLISSLPTPVSVFVAPLVPALIAFLTGYITQHTPRSSGLGADVDRVTSEEAARAAREVLSQARLVIDHASGTARIDVSGQAGGS